MKKSFAFNRSPFSIQRLVPVSTALVFLFAGSVAQAVNYYKANNTTSLNNNASWLDQAGAAIATTPANSTTATDTLIWDSRVLAANTVNMGGDIGIGTVKIVDPGGAVAINGSNNTLTITNGGGVNMSSATSDLTIGSGIFYRVASSSATISNNVAAGRVLTLNCPITVRNNSTGVTVNHPGAGTTIYNGTFAPTNVNISAGEVQFNAAAGSTRINTSSTNSTTVNGGRLVVTNTSGSATGSGTVTINDTGTLTGTGAMTGTVTINSGGTLIPRENAIGTIKTGNLTLAAGSKIKWEADTANALSDLISVTGGVTINGGTIELYNSGTTDAFTGTGVFNLISYTTGTPDITKLAVADASKIAGQTYTFGLSGGYVTLNIEVGARPQTFWNADADGAWSNASNWTGSAVPNAAKAIANLGGVQGVLITANRTVTLGSATTVGELNIDSTQSFTLAGTESLTFDDGDLGGGVLTVASGSHQISAPLVLTSKGILTNVTNAASTLTVDGGISGAGDFTFSGAGTLALTADNTYTGITTIGSGVLKLGSGGETGSVAGAIANGGTLRINRSNAITLGSVISGAGSLVLEGAGTTTMSVANTYSGSTTLSAGALLLNNGLALQNSALTYSSTGGTLTYGELVTAVTLGALKGDGALPLTNSLGMSVALTVQNSSSASYSGSTIGTGTSFAKSGGGTFALSGAHAYSGNATINAGTLSLDSGANFTAAAITLGSTSGCKLTINGGTLQASTAQTLVTNASAGIDLVSGSATFGNIVTSGSNTASGASFIRASSGTLTAASLSMARGALSITSEPATGQTANGLYVNGADVHITGAANFGVNTNSSVSARMDSGNLTVDGPFTVAINNPTRWSVLDINGGIFNSNDVTTGICLGGATVGEVIMRVRGANSIVNAQRVQFSQTGIAGVTLLDLAAGSMFVGAGGMVLGSDAVGLNASLRLAGGTLGATADSSSNVPVSLTGAAVVTGADASDVAHAVTFSGNVTGTGTLVKNGSGSVSFTSSNNAFSGAVTVTAGTLGLAGQSGAVGVGADGTLIPSGTLSPQADSTINGTLGIRYNVDNLVAPGRIHSLGVLTLGAASVLDISGSGALTESYYVIASAASGVTGTFATVNGLPSGYKLVYNFNNGSGVPVVALVPDDTTAPVITLSGDATVSISAGSSYTDAGATATDNVDSSVTVSTSGSVNTAVPGNYTLTYSATDAAGNQATPVTRTVTVSDTTAPLITLSGEATVSISVGGSYTDAGATATDNVDGSVTVTTTGTVDTAVPGNYTLTYSATDAAGNQATPVTRTVTVIVPTFSDWASGYGLSGANAAADADPDKDGIKNGVEYVLGGNPTVSDAATIAPTGAKSGSNYVYTFKRTDVSEANTTVSVEYGNNLSGWTSYSIGAVTVSPVVITENDTAADTVVITIPNAGATKFFARLKVITN